MYITKLSLSGNLEKIKIESRPYSNDNFKKLYDEIEKIDWDTVLNYEDPENCSNRFLDKLNIAYRHSFPLKTKFISQKRLKNKWITSEVKQLINKKSEYFSKFRRGIISKEENNRLKNQINAQINKAKNKYYQFLLEKFKNNLKKSWNTIASLMGKPKPRTDIINLLDGTSNLTDTKDIVEKFADHFSNIGPNLDSKLQSINQSPYNYMSRNNHSFYLFPATPDETLKIISKAKVTSTDVNSIPIKIFKSLKNLLCYPMTKIINASFRHGVFPQNLKLAKITPIYKKGDKNNCTNYRPISSLSFLSKIFERLMTNRIISFFNKFSLFSEKQFGFLKKRSTQDALFDFTEAIYEALNLKKHNISILVDLKSAFDTVNHEILLGKLELYGVRGLALQWLKSYLSNREFHVAIQQTFSARKTVNIGIPQGSIIGPILFIIYNNDLPMVSNKINTTLFADDTNFSLVHDDYETMVPILNCELEKISNWTISNRLTINTAKTELMLFTNRKIPHGDGQVILNGTGVDFVDHARFLGVTVDNKINFKNHINQVVGKVSRHAGILRKIKNNLPLASRITYYNSFVLPYLTFNILHWGNTDATHLNPLITIQKNIIRTITDSDRIAHTNPLFLKLKFLKLNDLYKYQAVLDTRAKILAGKYKVTHGRNTRFSQLALPRFHRLSRTQQSVSFNGPLLWNELPEELRKMTSLSIFKNKLKSFYLQNYV